MITLHHGDCLEILKDLADNSLDAIVTDPPYGLNFMAKKWDYDVPTVAVWQACLRVLKPGGHLLAFGGSRTQHRMTINIEDAGFEIRDMIAWLYGSGFPKSLNVGKAIDKAAGAEREVIGIGDFKRASKSQPYKQGEQGAMDKREITDPATAEAQQWDGWGTGLKPAIEPITLARKPLSEKTVAANVLKWGTGAINIESSRVEYCGDAEHPKIERGPRCDTTYNLGMAHNPGKVTWSPQPKGRWPANVIHDGSDEVLERFPQTTPSSRTNRGRGYSSQGSHDGYKRASHDNPHYQNNVGGYNDRGTAARFFYCAKASKSERNLGCKQIEPQQVSHDGRDTHIENPYQRHDNIQHNNHPTVKPIKLMQYLVSLVTPPGGTVLDPFMGSGSTGIACQNKGYCFIGIERDEGYFKIAQQRLTNTTLGAGLASAL